MRKISIDGFKKEKSGEGNEAFSEQRHWYTVEKNKKLARHND